MTRNSRLGRRVCEKRRAFQTSNRGALLWAACWRGYNFFRTSVLDTLVVIEPYSLRYLLVLANPYLQKSGKNANMIIET